MAIVDTIGKKIKHLRLLRGLTQEEFAFRLGISLPAYSKIERGITDINVSRLEQISEELGVKPVVFFAEPIVTESTNLLAEPNNSKYLMSTLRDKEEIILLQRKYIEQLEAK
jgi:transcriptional regulator with XRE-family HTH domain